MRPTQPELLSVLALCLSLASCTSSSNNASVRSNASVPTSTVLTAPSTTTAEIATEITSSEPLTSVDLPDDLLNVSSDDWLYQGTNTETWRYGPRVVQPGVSDFMALTADEICPLIDVSSLLDRLGVKATLEAPVWRQTDFQTECSVTVKVDGTEDFQTITWESARYDKSVWPRVGVDGSRTVEDVTVDGREARLSITTDGFLKGVSVLVAAGGDRAITLDIPDLGLLVERDVMLDISEQLVQKFAALKPAPQPALDAAVPSPFDLSAAQVCSLMQDKSLETWVGDKDLIFIDGYELTANAVNCSRGAISFVVSISNLAPYIDESLQPDESGYLAKVDLDGRSGYRRRYLKADKSATESVAVFFPWRSDYWVEFDVRFPAEGPKLDELLNTEMRHILQELEQRVSR